MNKLCVVSSVFYNMLHIGNVRQAVQLITQAVSELDKTVGPPPPARPVRQVVDADGIPMDDESDHDPEYDKLVDERFQVTNLAIELLLTHPFVATPTFYPLCVQRMIVSSTRGSRGAVLLSAVGVLQTHEQCRQLWQSAKFAESADLHRHRHVTDLIAFVDKIFF